MIVKHANPCGVAVADTHRRRVHAGQRLRPGQRVRRHRRRSTGPCRPSWPTRWAGVHRGGRRPGVRRRRAGGAQRQEEPARAVRRRPVGAAVRRATRRRRLPRAAARRRQLDRIDAWHVVTAAQPTDAQWDDLEFAWQVCAAVSSNAIVYVKDGQAFGIGAGQQNRVDSRPHRRRRAAGRAAGGACASDAFFPFRDGLDVAAAAGITAVIQPGGQRARRRGHRRRRRTRHRHGVHRRTPLPPLKHLGSGTNRFTETVGA